MIFHKIFAHNNIIMTVLDAAPLSHPVDRRKLRLIGNALIVIGVLFSVMFFISIWMSSDLVPSANIFDSEAHWYYQCLVPASFPATVFFAYWIWLCSQYFRSHRETM